MSPIRMEKIETALRVVLDFNDAFNRHDVGGMMQLMSDDCVFENTDPAPDGTVYAGKEAVTRFWQDFFHEFAQRPHRDRGGVRAGQQSLCHALAVQLGGRGGRK